MRAPSTKQLEAEFAPGRPRDLSIDVLRRVREHSKRMFGNQDRLEVAVGIMRFQLGRVNATDLSREVDVAVNRIRAQLLALEALELLKRTGSEDGKRMFERVDDHDRFWAFACGEFDDQIRSSAQPAAPGSS
jgi:hypothetical protein